MEHSLIRLVWNNHISNIQTVLSELYNHHNLADVTISCRDGTLKAHKIILSACSPYFKIVFEENPCKHSVVILKELSCYEMQILLQFMYCGFVNIMEEDISDIIQTAEELGVKGFTSAAVNKTREDVNNQDRDCYIDEQTSFPASSANDDSDCQEIDVDIVEDVGRNEDSHASYSENNYFQVHINHNLNENNRVKESAAEDAHVEANHSTQSPEKFRRCARKPFYKQTIVLSDTEDWNSKDEEGFSTYFDQSKLIVQDESVENKFNLLSDGNSFSDKDRRKKMCNDSAKNGLTHFMPDVEINEEQENALDYSQIQSAYGVGKANKQSVTDTSDSSRNFSERVLESAEIEDIALERRIDNLLKPHGCEFCSLAFSRSAHLIRHRRLHTGERPFACSVCQQTFTRQDKLTLHLRKYHATQTSQKRRSGRGRGMISKILQMNNLNKNVPVESDSGKEGRRDPSLPFGDTSYLSSLSLGQQKHLSATDTLERNANELLNSVSQFDENTIQSMIKQENDF